MLKEISFAEFVSHLSAATQEEKYEWRLYKNPKDFAVGPRQLALLATLDKRDDYSVVEVATRRLYRINKINYALDSISLALSGNLQEADKVYREIGVSLAVMYMAEGASLTFDRERPLTPVHEMLAEATKIEIKFQPPMGGTWAPTSTWSKTAYNYDDLLSSRRRNLTEDQQRRIEGLVLALTCTKKDAIIWLEEFQHTELVTKGGWKAIELKGIKVVEKYICGHDKPESGD